MQNSGILGKLEQKKLNRYFFKFFVGNDRLMFTVLEKDDNMGYNLSTHGDIEKISSFPNEKEVLFFPFSSFEIKGIKEINIGKEKGYEIKL